MSANISRLTDEFKSGKINGNDLASMVQDGKITKQERRKISKLTKQKELTPRQLLRREIKSKKQQPKLSKDDRHKKYVTDKNDTDREMKQSQHMTCLGCRKSGHILKHCPDVNNLKRVVCFNCGEVDHALRHCTKPITPGYLPFAECFICKQKGHISKDCNLNINGLYPNGGCCHICLKKDHLVKDCKLKPPDEKTESFGKNEVSLSMSDDVLKQRDDYIEELVMADDDENSDAEVEQKKSRKKSKRST